MADPLDIWSVAQVKAALRVAGDDPAYDDLLAGYIAGAVGWIAEVTGYDLTDDDYAATDVPKRLRAAIALMVRAQYDLDSEWWTDNAITVLLNPYRKF